MNMIIHIYRGALARTEEPPRRGPIEAWATDSQAINVPATQINIDASQ